MLSSIKRVLITLSILTAAVILGLFFYTRDRTYYTKNTDPGNTLGNIYNGGLFCVNKDTVYFSNDMDDGKLYSMDLLGTHIRKIFDAPAAYINADKNYIYYVQANDIKEYNPDYYAMLSNSGLYRIDNNGSNLKNYTGDPCGFVLLQNNYLFFERYTADNGFHLARYKIDGSMGRNMAKDAIPYLYADKYIYYVDTSQANISMVNLSSFTKKTHISGSIVYPIPAGKYIYYINPEDNNRIYRMNLDGTERTLLVKQPCSTYNITDSGKYLYYQTNGTKKNELGRINLKTMQTETVREGQYKQINVTDYYVFFKSPKNKETYMQLADEKINVLKFTPGY